MVKMGWQQIVKSTSRGDMINLRQEKVACFCRAIH